MGDYECLERMMKKLMNVVNKDIRTLEIENFERRTQLWNEIKENMEKVRNGEFGDFPDDIQNDFDCMSMFGLLKLAYIFSKKSEKFHLINMFTEKELSLPTIFEGSDFLEIITIKDLKSEILKKDQSIMDWFEKYIRCSRGDVNRFLMDVDIKLPIRYAVKKLYSNRIGKCEKALQELFGEYPELIQMFPDEATKIIAKEEIKMKEKYEKEISEEKKILEIEKKMLEEEKEKLSAYLKKVEETGRYVKSAEAKMYEVTYIEKFCKKMKNFKNVDIFDGKKKITLKLSKEAVINRENESVGEIPSNMYALLEIKKGLFSKYTYIIMVKVLNHINSYNDYGCDCIPITIGEFATNIDNMLRDARNKNYKLILGLSSPTGFSSDVLDHIQSKEFHKNFLSDYLSLCLVDIEKGEIYYNEFDETIKNLHKIFEVEFDVEKMERCRRAVEKEIDESKDEFIVLKEITEKTNYDESYIKKIFMEYKDKGYMVKYGEGVGLVLWKNVDEKENDCGA